MESRSRVLCGMILFVSACLILFTLISFENLSVNMCGSDLLKINENMTLEICNNTFNVKLSGGGKISVNVPRFEKWVLNTTV